MRWDTTVDLRGPALHPSPFDRLVEQMRQHDQRENQHMAQKDVGRGRFHSLDALRGIAALAVVFWHWQHFFFEGSSLPKDFKQAQMLLMFDVLRIFYERGWLAVDLFFSLSGFIFFWLYADAINDRRVSGQKYFILRFSRLFPLHLFTLLAVALEQIIYSSIKGNDFVYQLNDLLTSP